MKSLRCWTTGVATVVGLLVIGRLLSDYYAFFTQREAWHRRCDVSVSTTQIDLPDTLRAASCRLELEDLMAYAKRKGFRMRVYNQRWAP
jgi:hypothetical protein